MNLSFILSFFYTAACMSFILKLGKAIFNLFISRRIMKNAETSNEDSELEKVILILIPVLREQKIIKETLIHYSRFLSSKIRVYFLVVGSIRERIDSEGNQTLLPTTKDVTEDCIKKMGRDNFFFVECDLQGGERSNQLNFGFNWFLKNIRSDVNIVGVFDADSRPELSVFHEAAVAIEIEGVEACQQPLNYIEAANSISRKGGNPIIVANAIIQNTWSMIKELPCLFQYFLHSRKHPQKAFSRIIYLNGHGMFFSVPLLFRIQGFPENSITDGVQIGYRLSLLGIKVMPLRSFCHDDVPVSVMSLINQHSRWFGGGLRFLSAFSWAKGNKTTNNGLFPILDAFQIHFSWAFGPFIAAFMFFFTLWVSWTPGIAFFILYFVVYCYVIPFFASQISPVRPALRPMDWLCLPLAILIKSIGPNLFIYKVVMAKFQNRPVELKKVER